VSASSVGWIYCPVPGRTLRACPHITSAVDLTENFANAAHSLCVCVPTYIFKNHIQMYEYALKSLLNQMRLILLAVSYEWTRFTHRTKKVVGSFILILGSLFSSGPFKFILCSWCSQRSSKSCARQSKHTHPFLMYQAMIFSTTMQMHSDKSLLLHCAF
jgi:hypothetical protein